MNPRLIRRAVALVFVLLMSIVRFWLMRLGGNATLENRARWVQQTCKRVLRAMDICCHVDGAIPANGVVVANHLTYLDIAILSAAMPCFFVAKTEIERWPYFGKAASVGGTLFINRSSLTSAEKVAKAISERLKLSIPVLFFPEGTSTDGAMLRFHSRLFEPAVRVGAPVTAATIRYVTSDGSSERELCWFGDDDFGPHLVKTLRMPAFHAEIHFGEPHVYANRRTAAKETFAEIAATREMTRAEMLQPV